MTKNSGFRPNVVLDLAAGVGIAAEGLNLLSSGNHGAEIVGASLVTLGTSLGYLAARELDPQWPKAVRQVYREGNRGNRVWVPQPVPDELMLRQPRLYSFPLHELGLGLLVPTRAEIVSGQYATANVHVHELQPIRL